jgi:hypothetical protein
MKMNSKEREFLTDGPVAKERGLPRGKPFKKGEPSHHQFQPGNSGNVAGRPEGFRTICLAVEACLHELAPLSLCRALGFSKRKTWVDVIVRATIEGAVFNTQVCKEIRVITEGRLPRNPVIKHHSTISPTAKELLLSRLRPITQ